MWCNNSACVSAAWCRSELEQKEWGAPEDGDDADDELSKAFKVRRRGWLDE
jgi:hypothetical protein